MRGVIQTLLVVSTFCAPLGLFAQRGGIEFKGIPASVTSPRADGSLRGIPASVSDPRPSTLQPGSFCCRHGHKHSGTPVYAVPNYGYYGYPDYSDASYYDQPQQPVQQQAQQLAPPPQVIIIKDDRSSAKDEAGYEDQGFEGGDSHQRPAPRESARANVDAAPPAAPEQLPKTTLVYRDGHKAELRNYAIVGSNLIDLTKSSFLKKIPLDSLDLEATRRENEENGVEFHVP
jgi:hypothetical protein